MELFTLLGILIDESALLQYKEPEFNSGSQFVEKFRFYIRNSTGAQCSPVNY